MFNADSFSADSLCRRLAAKPCDIYVVMSADGSTIMQDPGLDQAYAVRNKKVAEETAALARKQGIQCYATDLETALASILKHPKNLPPRGAHQPNGG